VHSQNVVYFPHGKPVKLPLIDLASRVYHMNDGTLLRDSWGVESIMWCLGFINAYVPRLTT